jgi:4'-phosphopantetheinyl transferase
MVLITANGVWIRPLLHPVLEAGDVHLWRVSLDQHASVYCELERFLSADERERAGRFHFERDRRRFSTGRGILRAIIGGYLRIRPERVEFSYGLRGKPALAMPVEQGTLRFNISHSRNLALFAFTRDQDVGVDLEYVHTVPDGDQIAERFFSGAERIALQSLPPDQRQEAFFNCWTRKEAYIKAIGDGLSQPLERFDVTLAPGDPACLLRVDGDEAQAQRWSMLALTPDQGYKAALVLKGRCRSLSLLDWESNQMEGLHALE